jgi:hypothetical protein
MRVKQSLGFAKGGLVSIKLLADRKQIGTFS